MCGGAAAVRRRSSGGGVVEQGRFLLSLHACLCVFEDNGRKRKEKQERAGERNREGGSGSGKQRKKKKERMEIMGIRVWWRKIKRKEKEKGNIWMIERKKGKIQFRNATTIFL